MKKYSLLIILIGFNSIAQKNYTSKSLLSKTFKNSVDQIDNKRVSTYSNPWISNNMDSIYYKKDTIIFKNEKSYNRDFCKTINWSFYKKNAFVLSDADFCNEPPTMKVVKDENWFTVKIIEDQNVLYLKLYNRNKLIEKFKVLSLNCNSPDSILTLLRVNP
jgi:hypothetical protein